MAQRRVQARLRSIRHRDRTDPLGSRSGDRIVGDQDHLLDEVAGVDRLDGVQCHRENEPVVIAVHARAQPCLGPIDPLQRDHYRPLRHLARVTACRVKRPNRARDGKLSTLESAESWVGMRRGKVGFWMRLGELVIRPTLVTMTRHEWHGQENIPLTGGAILAANHISVADPMVVAHFVYDRPRFVHFLAKSTLFDVPVLGPYMRKVQQTPVYRGSRDASKALEAAVATINDGEAVLIYPEGTTTKDPDLWPMQGKTGVARLALMTGAPVIPIAQWGAHVFEHPVTKKRRIRPRTPVSVMAGPPVDLSQFSGESPNSIEALRGITEAVMLRLREQVAELRGEPAPTGPLYVPPARAAKEGA